jgi:hypothetical protein
MTFFSDPDLAAARGTLRAGVGKLAAESGLSFPESVTPYRKFYIFKQKKSPNILKKIALCAIMLNCSRMRFRASDRGLDPAPSCRRRSFETRESMFDRRKIKGE